MVESGLGLLVSLGLVTVLLPAVVCCVAVFVARVLPQGDRFGVPIAWAFGYLAAHVAIAGAPVWPPVTSAQGIVVVLFAATVVSVLLGSLSGRSAADVDTVPDAGTVLATRLVPLASLVCLAAILWFSLRSMIRYQWQGLEAGLWVTAIAILIAALQVAGNALRMTSPPLAQLLAWGLGFLGLALALVMSSTALMAQLSAVCAVLAITVWATGAAGNRSAFVSLPPILLSLLSVFVLSGTFYADLPVWSGALLLIAPTAGLLASSRIADSRRRALAAALTVVLIQAPALGAAGIRFLESGENEYDGYDYGDLAPRAGETHG